MLLLFNLSACTTTSLPQRAGMYDLFDGHTLDGWHTTGDAQWRVEGGEIVASGPGDGFLRTNEEYRDFHLVLEFWVDETTNSGVFFRCRDEEYIHPDTCYEANIWDQHPQQAARTGALVFKAMPPMAQVNTVGKWNTYKIAAEGTRVLVEVNDQTTAFLRGADTRAGFIALQHWRSGTVRFRNIRIREL